MLCQDDSRGGMPYHPGGALPASATRRDRTAMKVIVRAPGEAFRHALSEDPDRDTIDVVRAGEQHAAFVAELRAAGVTLVELRADDQLADACFVSDVLITLPAAA